MNRNRQDENKNKLLASAIVAKAAIKRGQRVEIICVFQESTAHEFYWVFLARSARSPRRSWKLISYAERSNCAYTDFPSFVESWKRDGKVIGKLRMQARRLKALMSKTNHGSIHEDWSAKPQDRETVKTDRVNEKTKRGRMGKRAYLTYGW